MATVSVSLTPYLNLSGSSGVSAFALLRDSVVVQFGSGDIYLYGPQHPGADHVEHMKQLAVSGRGLSTYISRVVRDDYEARSLVAPEMPGQHRRH